MDDSVRQEFIKLIAYHGSKLCDNPQQLGAMLGLEKWRVEHSLEKHLLISALKEGIAADLLEGWAVGPVENLLPSLTERLQNSQNFCKETARWAVNPMDAAHWSIRVLASALGVIPWELKVEQDEVDLPSEQTSSSSALSESPQAHPEIGILVFTLKGDHYWFRYVAWSPDGQTLATAHAMGVDGPRVRLWRASDGKPLYKVDSRDRRLLEHTDHVECVLWSPDGQILASSAANNVWLWRSTDDVLLGKLKGHTGVINSIAWSPDGKMLASGSNDNTVRLWRLPDGALLHVLEGHTDKVWRIDFAPDGQAIASGSKDGTARIWQVDGTLLHILKCNPDGVKDVTFSPDGEILATANDKQGVQFWCSANSRLLDRLQWIEHATFTNNVDGTQFQVESTGIVTRVAYHPDGQILAMACPMWYPQFGYRGDQVQLWSVGDQSMLGSLRWNWCQLEKLAWSPDGKMLAAAGTEGSVKVWRIMAPIKSSAKSGLPQNNLRGHTGTITQLSWSSDGKILASASNDSTVKLWQTATCELLYSLGSHQGSVTTVAWNPVKTIIASGSDDNLIRLWQASDGKLLRVLRGHLDQIKRLAWSPDGKMLASASNDDTVRIWRTSGLLAGSVKRKLELATRYGVRDVVWSPDGQTLAISRSMETIELWQASTGKHLKTLEKSWDGYPVVWSSDGENLAFGGDREVVIHRVNEGTQLRFMGHVGFIRDLVFSPGCRTLASVGMDNTIRLWSVFDGHLRCTLPGHQVTSLAWSPGGRTLVSGHSDGTIRLWRV